MLYSPDELLDMALDDSFTPATAPLTSGYIASDTYFYSINTPWSHPVLNHPILPAFEIPTNSTGQYFHVGDSLQIPVAGPLPNGYPHNGYTPIWSLTAQSSESLLGHGGTSLIDSPKRYVLMDCPPETELPPSPITVSTPYTPPHPASPQPSTPYSSPQPSTPYTPVNPVSPQTGISSIQKKKRKRDTVVTSSTVKSQKKTHDSTPPLEYLERGIKLGFEVTGLEWHKGIVGYSEEKFFEWLKKQKPEGNVIKLNSFFEKFDKSRRVNRLNPNLKYGPIKFLKLDKHKLTDYPPEVRSKLDKIIKEIEEKHPLQRLKYLTYREWEALEISYFEYKN